MSNIKGLGEDGHLVSATLLEKIDKLREKNVGQYIPLPQLVVVGDQSSGKSSLLESLTGIPFPRDVELCTRYATQITQQRDDVSSVKVSIIPGPNASEEHKQHVESYHTDALSPENFRAQFPSILQEVNRRMGIRMTTDTDSGYTSDDSFSRGYSSTQSRVRGSAFSEDVLKIEISGPSVDYLTVIDVPGIFRTPMEGRTTKDDIEMVKRMVERYIRDDRTIILAVLPCNIDMATQEILTLAEQYDPSGERTLGILTKPDLVVEASAKQAVCNIVLGKRKQLTLGYYVVRSRGADQTDAEFARREEMFNEAPWNKLPRDRVGVQALKERLAELLSEITRSSFPAMRSEIEEKLRENERWLEDLGPSRKDAHEQRKYLAGIAGRFQTIVRQALEANYTGNDAFELYPELRLATLVVNLADDFNCEFRKKGLARRFEVPGSGDEDDDSDEEEDGNLWMDNATFKEIIQKIDAIEVGDAFPELSGILPDVAMYPDQYPKDGITEWLTGLYMSYRGMDLGGFSNSVWASAWKEQSANWPAMGTTFVSRVILAIHRFLKKALRHVCADPRIREQLWLSLRDEVLERYQAAIEEAGKLVAAERDGKPYTLDEQFNKRRQLTRDERLVAQKKSEERNEGDSRAGERNGNRDNVEDVVNGLHDDLKAYYEIARRRFVDSLLNQVVNYQLLYGPSEATPLGVFSQDWVIDLRPDQLETIAGEKPSIRDTREKLMRTIENLKEARNILR